MEEHSALLRLVRAVTLLDGVAAEPTHAGVRTGSGARAPVVAWSEVAALLGEDDPLDRGPRLRLAVLLLLHRQAALLGDDAAAAFRAAVRPLALPTDHPLHPGAAWVREAVPGGVLDLGVGVLGLVPGGDVLPLPSSVALVAGLDCRAAWRRARALGEDSGRATVTRLLAAPDRPTTLTGGPTDGIDALTLLALPAVRDRLGGPVAAPARGRAWLGRRAWNDEYLRAVWMLTPAARRGVLGALTAGPAGVARLRPVQRSGSSPIGS